MPQSISLQRMLAASYKGFTDDRKEVEKITQDFLNMSFREICSSETEREFLSFFDILESIGLPEEELYNLTYRELAEQIVLECDESFTAPCSDDLCSLCKMYFAYGLKEVLRRSTDIRVKLFLSLSVKCFFRYLERIWGNPEVRTCFRTLCDSFYDLCRGWKIESNTTIGYLLSFKMVEWNPRIRDYEDEQYSMLEFVYELLVKSFHLAFKQKGCD